MWRMSQKPQTQRVTKKLIDDFVSMTAVPRDRPLSERRLIVYQNMLKAGGFRPVTWAKCLCLEDGVTYRVNGKHTAHLLAAQNPLPEFYVVIESYEAPDLDDVIRLYATFDSKFQARNAKEIYLSFAGSIPELAEVSQRIIILAVTGIAMHTKPEQPQADPPAERAERLLDHPKFALWLDSLEDGQQDRSGHSKTFAPLARAGVAGAMFGTWLKAPKDATTFWTAVRDETGTRPDLPDRRLARWLAVNVAKASAQDRPARRVRATAREFYARSVNAWNAYRKGTTTELKYFPGAKLPAIL